MKCPYCEAKIGFFSKEMNRASKTRVCPHCGKEVKLALNYTRFAGVFFVIAIGAVLFGVSGPVASGVAGGLAAFAGMGLKPVEA